MNSFPNQEASLDTNEEDFHKYVIFRLAEELYGAALLDVREVVERLPIKSVPNTVEAFEGVCNLRGQIIGVVDLRTRFSLQGQAPLRPILLVFESDSGAIAAQVDEIISVAIIPSTDIEVRPNIVSAVPLQYIRGIGKYQERLVTLIDLRQVLSSDELTQLDQSKLFTKPGLTQAI